MQARPPSRSLREPTTLVYTCDMNSVSFQPSKSLSAKYESQAFIDA